MVKWGLCGGKRLAVQLNRLLYVNMYVRVCVYAYVCMYMYALDGETGSPVRDLIDVSCMVNI